MKRFNAIFLSVLLALSVSCRTENSMPGSDRLDEFFDAIGSQYMGSVAVSMGGRTVYTHTSGFADIDAGIPATVDSRYMIGSISKTFTASLVLKAAEEGRLSLDDKLADYFPSEGIPNASGITLDDLLYHRSGLHDIFEDATGYYDWYTTPQSRADLLAKIAAAAPDFEPGASQQYCNAGYVLLTFVLEDVYGRSYAKLLHKKIAGPLGLGNVSLSDGIDPEKGECRSYTYRGGWNLEAETDPSVPLGAGAIMSDAADLLKFADALFHGKLGDSVLRQMKSVDGEFGRGLFPVNLLDKNGSGHNGGIDGFQSAMCHFDDGDVTVVMCSNGNNLNQDEILYTVLQAVYGQEYVIPSFDFINLPPDILETYIGDYHSFGLGMTLHITTDGKVLVAQVDGQSPFCLEADSETWFECPKAGIGISFEDGNLLLHQAGQTFEFWRVIE
ncbi:MAG: serine hydrolase domain-containing protein [Bacteroidia bacterium]|nr:serine hydrolase domain-containing protein [Bacteroidia bacterium]